MDVVVTSIDFVESRRIDQIIKEGFEYFIVYVRGYDEAGNLKKGFPTFLVKNKFRDQK